MELNARIGLAVLVHGLAPTKLVRVLPPRTTCGGQAPSSFQGQAVRIVQEIRREMGESHGVIASVTPLPNKLLALPVELRAQGADLTGLEPAFSE